MLDHLETAKRLEKLIEALEKIANPINYLSNEAKKAGGSLDGGAALALAADASWLRSIAVKALIEHRESNPDDSVVEWPDGTWCYRDEVGQMSHMGDDYAIVPYNLYKHGR